MDCRVKPGNDGNQYRRRNVTAYFGRLACAAAFLMLFVSLATAQPYPTRQITLIVPFAPGGPADFLGRLIGQKMSEDLGQQIVVDNRPGANTIIGAQAVAKASPDGYMLLMAIDGTLVMNPFLYSKLAYDPFKDFVPISLVALVPSALVGNIKLPVNSIKDLVEQEKAKVSAQRLSLAPDIPAIAETFPGYDLGIWQSIVAPAGTPRDVVTKLHGSIKKVLALPEVREKLLTAGIEPASSNTPEEFAAFIRSQADTRAKVIQAVGMKLD